MKIHSFSQAFIDADKVISKIPLISSLSTAVTLFLKVVLHSKKPEDIQKNAYHHYVKFDKTVGECVALLVPVLGNIAVALYRHLKYQSEDPEAKRKLERHEVARTTERNVEMPLGEKESFTSPIDKIKEKLEKNQSSINDIPRDHHFLEFIGENPNYLDKLKDKNYILLELFSNHPTLVKKWDKEIVDKALDEQPNLINFLEIKQIKMRVLADPSLANELDFPEILKE